jgi:hypothetical protein
MTLRTVQSRNISKLIISPPFACNLQLGRTKFNQVEMVMKVTRSCSFTLAAQELLVHILHNFLHLKSKILRRCG